MTGVRETVLAAENRPGPHPVDRLIRELLGTGRSSTADEIDQIIQRMGAAPFPTAAAHRDRHTEDEQWATGTTVEQYTDDLRRSVNDPRAPLAIYVRRGGHLAATLTNTARIIADGERGSRSVPLLFVVYSADRGMLVTGYQASSPETIAVPENIRWLR